MRMSTQFEIRQIVILLKTPMPRKQIAIRVGISYEALKKKIQRYQLSPKVPKDFFSK